MAGLRDYLYIQVNTDSVINDIMPQTYKNKLQCVYKFKFI